MTRTRATIFDAGESLRLITEIVRERAEWLYVRSGRVRSNLLRSELDFREAHARIIFSCLSDEGSEVWRVRSWEWTGKKLLLEAERRAGKERALLELIPRISSRVLAAEVSALRRARCDRLARLASAELARAVIERASLSAGPGLNQPGSFARILLMQRSARIAVTGIVGEPRARSLDALLSSALVWFERLRESGRKPAVNRLWIVVEKACVEALRQRVALLREDLRRAINIYELDETWNSLTTVQQQELAELFITEQPRIAVNRRERSETAQRIAALSPDAIDVVRARHGETLRFRGLAFARVRRLMSVERTWFGLDPSSRKILDDSTQGEWEKLLDQLEEHRRAEPPSRRHALYKQAAEAWLESILRRDITRLDPGLRLAPLHAQFRVGQKGAKGGARPVDLLALRRDGRLAVIEIKTAEDREHVLQGADYWRRIEAYRRAGAIRRARLFDDAEILDEPPLVYLVAPALRFHRSFALLARALRPEIELYRFDINEDWRAGIRVLRRQRVN
jgi:hypothetical protein